MENNFTEISLPPETSIPVQLVPTPTSESRTYRKLKRAAQGASSSTGNHVTPSIPVPILLPGSRVIIYKQDPSVGEIGLRKVFLPAFVSNGPMDSRINSSGLPPVSKNAFDDFIQTPGTSAFNAVQAFAVVRMTLTMVQRALAAVGVTNPIPWQWNSATNTEKLSVFAEGLPDVMNAFYSRAAKGLKFGHFVKPSSAPAVRVYTCLSLDIVAHETGHAILDSLKPGWIGASSLPQTGGLHESFGDITAIFLALSQMDEVEALIAQTKSNLHDKNFIAELAEEFGLSLGRSNGLRNADNDLKLSEVTSEVHAISQVFTGGIYDVLADIFSFDRNFARKDDARTLYDTAQYLYGLILRAIIAAPASNASYADVVNEMIRICAEDGKKVDYRNFIRNRFVLREVVVAPSPMALTEDHSEETILEASAFHNTNASMVQDRSRCCGTMKLEEYYGSEVEELLQNELNTLASFFDDSSNGNGNGNGNGNFKHKNGSGHDKSNGEKQQQKRHKKME